MLIEPIEVLSEALPPIVPAAAPEALPPVEDIEPLALAPVLLPKPMPIAPAPALTPPNVPPPPAPTLLPPPAIPTPPSPPDLPLELTPEPIFDMLISLKYRLLNYQSESLGGLTTTGISQQ
jgi:hypothetical protein